MRDSTITALIDIVATDRKGSVYSIDINVFRTPMALSSLAIIIGSLPAEGIQLDIHY